MIEFDNPTRRRQTAGGKQEGKSKKDKGKNLRKVIQNRTIGSVFDSDHTGVKAHTLRSGFEKACERAGIPFGLTVEGGLIWRDVLLLTLMEVVEAVRLVLVPRAGVEPARPLRTTDFKNVAEGTT